MDTHQGVYNVILCSSDGSNPENIIGIPTFGFDSFLKRNVFLLCFQCWNFCFGKEMDLDKEVQLQLITTKL